MPVRVDIPIKLRVDPGALMERRADVEEALAAAVGRALGNSRDVVLEKRGGYVGVRVHPPEFRWYGDGLDGIFVKTRSEIELILSRVLSERIQSQGIYKFAQISEESLETLVDNPVEAIDDNRYALLLNAYALPAYDNGGRHRTLPVRGGDEIVRVPGTASDYYVWPIVNTIDQLRELLEAELELRDRSLPQSGYLGAIFQGSQGKKNLRIHRFPEDTLITNLEITNPTRPKLKGNGKGKKAMFVIESVPLLPTSSYRVNWYADASNPDQITEILHRFHALSIEQVILSNAKRLPGTTLDEMQQLKSRVRELLSELAKEYKDVGHVTFLQLFIDETPFLLGVRGNHTLPSDLNSELIPLIEIQKIRPRSHDGKSTKGKSEATNAIGSRLEGQQGTRAGDTGTQAGGSKSGTIDDMLSDGEIGSRSRTEEKEGDAQGQGGFVYTGSDDSATATSQFFPAFQRISFFRDTLVCESFQGEPSIAELGSDGEQLKQLMNEIAHKLQIPSCEFAGQFCHNAAKALGSRALDIGSYAVKETGSTRQVTTDTGNFGSIQFVPTASPAIQFMRHLAGVTPLISELSQNIYRTYQKPEHRTKIRGHRQNDPVGWYLDFLELVPLMEEAVGYLFVMTCRILLLQLLRASHEYIEKRLDNFKANAPLFEKLVLTQLADVDELIQLRDRLKTFQQVTQVRDTLTKIDTKIPGGIAIVPGMEWLEATRLVTGAITTKPNDPQSAQSSGDPGEILTKGEISRIRDRHNTLWTLVDLESAIATRRGLAEDIDPLIKHMTDIPEVMARFRMAEQFGFRSEAIQTELANILNKMKADNKEITSKVTDDWRYAFEASQIQESLPAASIPGTSFALHGIHLQAHEQIGEFFQGCRYYPAGINALFNGRLGQESLTSFFEFTGLVLLAILCPPAAAVAGIGLAVHQYGLALEKEMLYDALIDPESVISHAEVEAELFAAKLGLALAFIPEVGSVLKVGSYGVKAVSRAGLAGGSRLVGRYVARRITSEMLEALSRNLAIAFAKEVVTNLVMNEIMEVVMEPIIKHIEREATITGAAGGSQGAEMVRQMLAAEQQAIKSPSVLDSSKNDPDRRKN
jgi:hypothetical protein